MQTRQGGNGIPFGGVVTAEQQLLELSVADGVGTAGCHYSLHCCEALVAAARPAGTVLSLASCCSSRLLLLESEAPCHLAAG